MSQQKGFDCKSCQNPNTSEERIKELKKRRGCNGFEKPIQINFNGEALEVDCCPCKLITSGTNYFLQAYHFYKLGFLPNGVAWMEESAKLMEMFMIMDGIVADVERFENEKVKSEMRSKRNG